MSFLNAFIPACFPPHKKKSPCFQFLQMFNSPAEFFVLRFYAFGWWNNAENQWNCLNLAQDLHWSLHGSMGTADGTSWLQLLLSESIVWSYKILSSSFPPSSSLFFPIYKVRFTYGGHFFCQRKDFIIWRACVVFVQHAMTYLRLVAEGLK